MVLISRFDFVGIGCGSSDVFNVLSREIVFDTTRVLQLGPLILNWLYNLLAFHTLVCCRDRKAMLYLRGKRLRLVGKLYLEWC